MMLRIGLTGGIGSGKSTVANLFAELGVPIIDMDVIAREVVMPGKPALQEIKKTFGNEICDEKDMLDRTKLRAIIFDNAKLRAQLENIIHPRIREQVEEKIDQLNGPYCIIVIPLLFETGRKDAVNRVLVVDTSIEEQIQRTIQRDSIDDEYVLKIIATQIDRQTRLDNADDIISNTAGITELKSQIEKLHQKYLEIAHSQ